MKVRSRVLSLLLAITLTFLSVGIITTTTAAAAGYSDVEENASYYQAVSLLSALGLLKGYEDGSFKPEGDITRAEFAAVVVRALGQEGTAESSKGATQFNDVAADFWGSGYINIATTLGIINGYGDGNFGPQDNVTYEQAVKMVVCALGYEVLALNKVDNNPDAVWPRGYLAAATELGILPGVSGTEGVPAKRWQVARLVYNSLDVKLMEKVVMQGQDRYVIQDNKTLLSEKLLVYYGTGEFRANALETVSDSGVRARSGEVIIYNNATKDEETFKDGGLNTAGIVGRAIKYYYTESTDGLRTLVYIEVRTDSSKVMTIDAANIEGYSGTFATGITISYWEDRLNDTRVSTVTIEKNPTVMVNGGVPESYNEDILMPTSGSLELISSSGSSSYDKVLITSYETYVIKSINSTTKEIVDNYRNSAQNNTIKIDEDDANYMISIKRANGSEITFSNLAKWNVLSVKQGRSGSRTVLDIIASNSSVNGTITAIEDDENVKINGKSYQISRYFMEYADVNGKDKLSIDDSGNFYLDKDGKIAAFEKTASASTYYGYLLGASYKSGAYNFSLLKQGASKVETVKGANRVRIDGTLYSSSDGVDYIESIIDDGEFNINVDKGAEGHDIPSNYSPMLIQYAQNTSGEITTIQTLKSESFVLFDLKYNGAGKATYNSTKTELTGASGSTFRITSTTHVFVVPFDRGETTKYSYKKGTSYFKHTQSYYVEAYDVTGTLNTATAVVVYESGEVKLDANSPIAIIKSISGAVNDEDPDYDGKMEAYVFGYQNSGQLKTLTGKYNDFSQCDIGDVIRFELNGSGFVELIEEVYDVSGNMTIVNHADSPADPITGYKVTADSGLLYAVDDIGGETIMLARTTNPEEADNSYFDFKITSKTVGIGYDATLDKGKRVYTTDGDEQFSYTTLNNYMASQPTGNIAADEILVIQVFASNSLVQSAVYVIKNR